MAQSRTQMGGTGGTPSSTREEVFDILSNQRRRHTLHYLSQRGGKPVDLRELSRQLSAWENDVSPDEITHRDRKSTYTALRQNHLPKMDAAGVVNWDPNRGYIEPAEEFEEAELYLEYVPAREIPRSNFYLGLSALSAGFLLAVSVGLPPFGMVPEMVAAFMVVTVFAVSAAIDAYYDTNRQLGSDGPPPDLPPR